MSLTVIASCNGSTYNGAVVATPVYGNYYATL